VDCPSERRGCIARDRKPRIPSTSRTFSVDSAWPSSLCWSGAPKLVVEDGGCGGGGNCSLYMGRVEHCCMHPTKGTAVKRGVEIRVYFSLALVGKWSSSVATLFSNPALLPRSALLHTHTHALIVSYTLTHTHTSLGHVCPSVYRSPSSCLIEWPLPSSNFHSSFLCCERPFSAFCLLQPEPSHITVGRHIRS
jgi:hypothetical protein